MAKLPLELTPAEAKRLADELMWAPEALALAWPLFRDLVLEAAAARLDSHVRELGEGWGQLDEDQRRRRANAAGEVGIGALLIRGMKGKP